MSLIRDVNINHPLSAFGDIIVANLTPIVQLSFEYTIGNTQLTTSSTAGSGTVTQASGMAVCTTGTTTGSKAHLDSKRHTKYRPGLGGLLRGTALFTSPIAGTTQHIGIVDEEGSTATFRNGYTIGYEGTTFGVHRFQNDSVTTVALANCDDPLDGTGASGMTIDTTKLNVFAVSYQYLGAGAVQFMIESDSTGKFVVFHTIHYTNQNTEPSTHNPNYHIALHVDNGATTSSMIMKSASLAYFTEGEDPNFHEQEPQQSSGSQQKTGVTTEVAIFTIRNKSTYASKNNFIDIFLEHISASVEASSANNLATVRLVKDTTLGGTPAYSDINTSDSVIDIDTAGTTLTGGEELLSIELAGKNDRIFDVITDLSFVLQPGETLTLAGSSANSATINGSLLWKELF